SSALLVISQDIEKYEPYIDDIQNKVKTIRDFAVRVELAEKEIKELVHTTKNELKIESQNKDAQPHIPVKSSINFEPIASKYREIDQYCKEVNKIIEQVIKEIRVARDQTAGFSSKQIMESKATASRKLKNIHMKI